jgi:hypothetical protein
MSEQTTSSEAAVSELTALHQAIEATFKARIPAFKHVEAYAELGKDMGEPALLFAMTGAAPAPDTGTGKTALNCRFQAAVLVDATRKRAPLQAAILASRVAVVLRGQYWDVDFVEEPTHVQVLPDGSVPELAQFCVWVVEWFQVVHFGELEWPWEDEPPGSLLFGIHPGAVDPDAPLVTPEDA